MQKARPTLAGLVYGLVCTFWLSFLSAVSNAQTPGQLDLSFNPGDGLNGTADVQTVAIQADGKVLVAAGPKGLARLHPNGAFDDTFNPGIELFGSPIPLVLLPDGKMLAAGFASVDGRATGVLRRLRPDGSVDPAFNPGVIAGPPDSYPSQVCALLRQPDGKIVIGGYFSDVQDVSRSGIARLNADGTLDNSFDPGAGIAGGAWGRVFSMALQPDGKVLIAGSFTSVNGMTRHGLARLGVDGRVDLTFTPPAGPPFSTPDIRAIVLLPDGQVFTSNWERYNADGTRDLSFGLNGGAANGPAFALLLEPAGSILIGGRFTVVNGVPRNCVVRLNASGTLDGSFRPDMGTNATVIAMARQADGRVLVGGDFSAVGGLIREGIARINPDGGVDPGFDATGSGPNAEVHRVTSRADGKVLIGGAFTRVGHVDRARIAQLNSDGSLDRDFDPGTGLLWEATPSQTAVASMAVDPSGDVVVAGRFSLANGQPRAGLVRLGPNGSVDPGFKPVLKADYEVVEVLSLATTADGDMLIAGEFSSVNGINRNRIARLHHDGTLDTSFNATPGPGSDSAVYPPTVRVVTVQQDGRVIATGDFTRFNGTARAGIARLNADGSLDMTFSPVVQGGANGWIACVALQRDGRVLIGGDFEAVDGVARHSIARLNADGSLDSSFDPGSGVDHDPTALSAVLSIQVQLDGKILIAGGFTSVNGTPRRRVARLEPDGRLDAHFDPGGGANLDVLSMALPEDERVLIGGRFTAVGGVARPGVARLYGGASALRLESPRIGAGVFRFTVVGPSDGATCMIQATSDLRTWTNVAPVSLSSGSVEFVDDIGVPPRQRLYRVIPTSGRQ